MRLVLLLEGGVHEGGAAKSGSSGYLRYWKAVMHELAELGLEVHLATTRKSPDLLGLANELEIPYRSLNCRSSRDYPVAGFKFQNYVRHHGIDVIHANEAIQGAVAFGIAKRPPRSLRVFHRHHTVINIRGQRFLTRLAQRRADGVIAVSKAVAAEATRDGVSSDRLAVIYNGIPEPRDVTRHESEQLRKQLRLEASSRVVLVLGHLRPEKGHLILFKAISQIPLDRAGSIHLVVVGGGELYPQLLKLAPTLPTPVHLVGDQADISLWLSIADVVAVPSEREPFGLVAVEAMAAAKPVVASDVDGLHEVLGDQVGVLVPPGDAPALSRALQTILEDRSWATRLAREGRKRYESEFGLSRMVKAWSDYYNHLRTSQPD